jgi:hypothetical protein
MHPKLTPQEEKEITSFWGKRKLIAKKDALRRACILLATNQDWIQENPQEAKQNPDRKIYELDKLPSSVAKKCLKKIELRQQRAVTPEWKHEPRPSRN